jgi:gelsolin
MSNGTQILELFGSDLETKIKQASASGEPAWDTLRGACPGLHTWRVNNFRLDSINSDGLFHVGDSYVVLKTNFSIDRGYTYAIHFWLGAETSADEAGTAAYKAVELDTRLSGKPVQYREVQGNESDLFRSYYKDGIRYASGGNDSGFHHVVKQEYPTLLYWIHDNKVKQIPLLIDLVSHDDVFLLDQGDQIQIYRGPQSSHKEALLAEYEALSIKDQRPGVQIKHVESDDHVFEFCAAVGKHVETQPELYLIKDNNLIEQALVSYNTLQSENAYLLKFSNTVWVWIGSKSELVDRKKAWSTAVKLTSAADRLSIVQEGKEPEAFLLSLFQI